MRSSPSGMRSPRRMAFRTCGGGTIMAIVVRMEQVTASVQIDCRTPQKGLSLAAQRGDFVFRNLVDLSSHNANPPGVFDGDAVPISDVADARLEEAIAALRDFVNQRGRLPTAKSWTEAAMWPSEKTIRRQFGSFRGAIQRAGLSLD